MGLPAMSSSREDLEEVLRGDPSLQYIYSQLLKNVKSIKDSMQVIRNGLTAHSEEAAYARSYLGANREALENLKRTRVIVSITEYKAIIRDLSASANYLNDIDNVMKSLVKMLKEKERDLREAERTVEKFIAATTAAKVLDYAAYAKKRSNS